MEDVKQAELSAQEEMAIHHAVERCCAEEDALIREIGVVYLQGMCDMLRVQGKLSQERADDYAAQARR